MAKAAPKRSRKPAKAPETQEESAVAVLDPPEHTEDEPAPQDPASPDVRPANRRPDPIPKILTFNQQVERIPKADWGPRASIRVYRKEPIIDRLRGSDTKYIMVYEEPVNEERIKHDHGSGRYKLFLNYKMPGAKEGREVDSVEFDILDRNFPPKVPPGEWVEDKRNNKWAWAKDAINPPVVAPAQQSNLQTISEVLDIADRLRPAPPVAPARPSTADEVKTMFDVAERIADAKKPPPQDNTILTIVTGQIDSLRTELAESRRRNDALMDKLIDARQPKEGNGIDNTVAAIEKLQPLIEKFLPSAKDAVESVTRGRGTPWYAELGIELARQSGPLWQMFAQVGAMKAMQAAQQQQNGAPHTTTPAAIPPPSQPQTQGPAERIFGMLWDALQNDTSGEDFAASVDTLYPMVYKQACLFGEERLIAMLKMQPVWNQLGPMQEKMPQFIHDFVAYGTEEEEEPSESGNPMEPVDLTAEGTI
jgi:hypothetical protein